MENILATILSTITFLVVVAIGLWFGYFAVLITFEQIQAWRLARQSIDWASTSGIIQTSEIIYEGIRRPREQPQITYTYQVNGTQYQGDRINFSFAEIYSKKEAEDVLALYPPNAMITVYYDPSQPAQSTLEQRHIGLASGLVVGLIIFLPTCLCLATGFAGLTGKVGR
jgi:hypothetical protein